MSWYSTVNPYIGIVSHGAGSVRMVVREVVPMAVGTIAAVVIDIVMVIILVVAMVAVMDMQIVICI